MKTSPFGLFDSPYLTQKNESIFDGTIENKASIQEPRKRTANTSELLIHKTNTDDILRNMKLSASDLEILRSIRFDYLKRKVNNKSTNDILFKNISVEKIIDFEKKEDKKKIEENNQVEKELHNLYTACLKDIEIVNTIANHQSTGYYYEIQTNYDSTTASKLTILKKAIETNEIFRVLSPEGLARELLRLHSDARARHFIQSRPLSPTTRSNLNDIHKSSNNDNITNIHETTTPLIDSRNNIHRRNDIHSKRMEILRTVESKSELIQQQIQIIKDKGWNIEF